MNRLERLGAELREEAARTRPHLEALEDADFAWRPHPRSFSAGELAAHLVECLGWAEGVFAGDAFQFDPATFVPFSAADRETLLEGFDARLARAEAARKRCDDLQALRTWRFHILDEVRFERPREEALRDMTLNHLIHHRGQLTVYLRLLGRRVPCSYGPTADDR